MEQQQKIHPHGLPCGYAIGSLVMMFAGLTSVYIVKAQPGKLANIRSAGFILVQHRGDRYSAVLPFSGNTGLPGKEPC